MFTVSLVFLLDKMHVWQKAFKRSHWVKL